MEIEKNRFLRKAVERLGLAPLTSMYFYAEGNRPYRMDWRPEIHDSDGLALWTGGGERVWRPLNNPERVITSAFLDRKSTRLNSSHQCASRMPFTACNKKTNPTKTN